MRQLASIKTISDTLPIEGKDRIELAVVDGWQVIVKKGEYQIGDQTIFCEIDSVLPDKPEFEFLKKNKFRIKTMKMAGVLSQGICFPTSLLPQGKSYQVGDDVTDVMGITKYTSEKEDPEPREVNSKEYHPIIRILMRNSLFRKMFLPKKESKGFPSFIPKTDETRIQNIPVILRNKDITFVAREKIDGQSGTFFLKKLKAKWFWQKDSYDFGVCSRNLRLWTEDNSSYWFVVKKYNIKQVLEQLIGDHDFVAIQGECVSPKVQGNKYKVSEPDLYAFNLIYPTGKVDCFTGEETLLKYGIKWAPLLCANYVLPDTVNELLDYATSNSVLYPTLREGVVLRNYNRNMSFKAVSPEFLIKNDE